MKAKEFWKEKFDEDPQTDSDKLAVAMMAEYGAHVVLLLSQQMEEKNINLVGLYDKCDICGCHPNIIIRTEFGTFCPSHAKYTK
jgi:hypothetical protein